jgi:hypothetical protein
MNKNIKMSNHFYCFTAYICDNITCAVRRRPWRSGSDAGQFKKRTFRSVMALGIPKQRQCDN